MNRQNWIEWTSFKDLEALTLGKKYEVKASNGEFIGIYKKDKDGIKRLVFTPYHQAIMSPHKINIIPID
jgi:hypothetical protein